jgi:hypothetical protein
MDKTVHLHWEYGRSCKPGCDKKKEKNMGATPA